MKTQTISLNSKLLILTLAPEDIRISRGESDETGSVFSSIDACGGFIGYFDDDITEEDAIKVCLLRSVHTCRPATGIIDREGLKAAHRELADLYRRMAENCAWQAEHRIAVCTDRVISHRGTSRHGIDTEAVIRYIEAAITSVLPLKD